MKSYQTIENYEILNNTTIPKLVFSKKEPTKVKAITFTDNGKTYYFSNEFGHRVSSYKESVQRPMTKKEYKVILAKMIRNTTLYGIDSDIFLEEISKLDFAEGHANKTFEIITPCLSPSKIHSLVMNLGNARYIYNQGENTVLQIDHSKRINGIFLPDGPEKDRIISKISSSKTMTKKIAAMPQ